MMYLAIGYLKTLLFFLTENLKKSFVAFSKLLLLAEMVILFEAGKQKKMCTCVSSFFGFSSDK